VKKAYKFRLSPTKQQEKKLFWTLELCREVYNAALTERRDAYNFHVRAHGNFYDAETKKVLTRELTVNYYTQKQELPEIKHVREEYTEIHSQVLQDVLLRLKHAFDHFFRRVREGAEEPGYPRFKGKHRFDSFTYPQADAFSLTHDDRLCLSKLGSIKIKLHREIEGTIKTVTIKHEAGQWYAIFSCEIEQSEPLPEVISEIGIDLGVTHFAALSDGTFIESPRHFRRAEKSLAKKQQHLSQCKRGSHRRERAKKQVARAHKKVARQRRDFHHKQARTLINAHQVIVFENLQVENLVKRPKAKQDENGTYLPNGASAKSGLNKSIVDNGLGQFISIVRCKAEEAGRHVYTIDPYKTSQLCSGCGKEGSHKDLSVRIHTCEHCGLVLDRDTNAAVNILMGWKSPTVWARLCGRRARAVEAPPL
jgi:putative transposase